MQAIGAGALNQAVKAVAIARGFVAPSGVDLICIPAFTDIMIDEEERTAIKIIVRTSLKARPVCPPAVLETIGQNLLPTFS